MAEVAVAATVAWILAAVVIGHPDPLFAPSAALMVLVESRGRRLRHSVELVLGVAVGVLGADLVVETLGRNTVSIFLVLLLTVGAMAAIGANSTLTVQAGLSALYLVAVPPPADTIVPFRFVDALLGGAVAIVVSQVTALRDPLDRLVTEARHTFADLARLIDDINEAIGSCDHEEADATLERTRRMHAGVERLQAAVLATAETVRLRTGRRRRLAKIAQARRTTEQLDQVVSNIWVLSRNAVTLTRVCTDIPSDLARAMDALAGAVRAAGEAVAADIAGDDPGHHVAEADGSALEAVRIAAKLLESDAPLPLMMIVGQIRSTAIDLLRGVDQDDDAVLSRVDEAVGLVRDGELDAGGS